MTDKKQELLTFFVISLALVSCSTLVYMLRAPSVTSLAVLDSEANTTILLVSVLILAAFTLVMGAILTINKLHKEKEEHKRAMITNKTTLSEHPNRNIVTYIIEARRAGVPDSNITKRLKQEGWEKEIIKKYL